MSDLKPNVLNSHEEVSPRTSLIYPEPYREGVVDRIKRPLGDVLGLTQFGVNHLVLEPGSSSSQRHWHLKEDEFVYILEGEAILETDAGETVLKPGMAVGFPAGKPDGHRIINKSDQPAVLLEVGTRSADEEVTYPDVNMHARRVNGETFITRKDGTPHK